MSNKRTLQKIAREIKHIKAQLSKQSGYDWSYIKRETQKVDWYDVREDDEELQVGYYGPGGSSYPDVSAYIILGNRYNPNGFYVEVSLNERIGEEYPDLAKKLSKIKGVDFDSPWGVTFDVDREDFLFEILGAMAKIMDKEM